MEKSCLHCHFFCTQSSPYKKDMSSPIISLSEKERENLSPTARPTDIYSPGKSPKSLLCYMGHWNERRGSLSSSNDKTIFKERNNCIFFMQHRPDMKLLAGAQYKRDRQREKTFKYFLMALITLVGSMMILFAITFLK